LGIVDGSSGTFNADEVDDAVETALNAFTTTFGDGWPSAEKY
jgi:hypothetical protein